MISRLFLILAATLILSASTARAEWVRIGRMDTGATMAMDAERIRTVAGKVQAWVQFDHSGDRTVRYRRSLELWSFNCAAQTMKALSVLTYDSYGKVVGSRSDPSSFSDYGYEPVTPDSMGETAFKVACAGAN